MGTGDKLLKVTLIKSLIGVQRAHVLNIKGLGLRRLNHTVCLPDVPSIRGMVNKVSYLVRIEA